ncbi:LOW QUALITY PROTEIN: hypothetical protein QYF61_022321 [Mycteria americana]|uniref:Endonuclease/exonuclease/phosphatase domain-containing protein n=1 Tax=Mycteria americana TaxID=33587 RepID=A0AAN7SGW5_MYCAM|nr:LOW QUALITY PROTEIN: hypothetical protein QYF61_022321 [Mycteria americana]
MKGERLRQDMDEGLTWSSCGDHRDLGKPAEKLRDLSLPSQVKQRLKGDLTAVCNYLQGSHRLFSATADDITSGNGHKLKLVKCRMVMQEGEILLSYEPELLHTEEPSGIPALQITVAWENIPMGLPSPQSFLGGGINSPTEVHLHQHTQHGQQTGELEAIVQQENYDIFAITETWWGDSHNWSAAMDGYKLFRRDRQGRRGGGVALYVRECLDCLELKDGDDRVECLWNRGKANKADIMVGVCYRPPNQDEEADEIFYKQLGEVSQSLALVLVGDFNLLDVCWKYNTVERKQFRKFLECVEDNVLTQLVSEPTREGALLDLLFVNREGLVGDVMVGGCLGHSDHERIEFLILGEERRGASRTAALDFQRADFGLFRRPVDRVPWEAVLKGKGVQEGWTFFKKEILKTQEQAVPMC